MNKINYSSPFAIYIHVPFCLQKCSYCDFYSQTYSSEKKDRYIKALKRELKIYADKIKYRKVRTIYFGGGTPGLLTPVEIAEILKCIKDNFFIREGIEITLEANPYSLSRDKIKGYRQCGVNRISLGVQSFNDQELDLLGRMHNSKQALRIIKNLTKVFDNMNLDLIFALPGQKCKNWLQTLKQALKMAPQHISTYNLEIHEDTPLGKRIKQGELETVSEELDARMYNMAREKLEQAGYRHYEISSFACPGYEAQHNKVYWQFDPYLGLGPAAHSFDGYRRFYNVADTYRYTKKLLSGDLPIKSSNFLEEKELRAEMIIMGLRLIKGINKKKFKNRFGICLTNIYGQEIEKL